MPVSRNSDAIKRADIEQRRSAIYRALGRYLDNDKVLAALRIWELHFANRPTYAIREFISTVCDSAELSRLSGEIYLRIVRELADKDTPNIPELEHKVRAYKPAAPRVTQNLNASKQGAAFKIFALIGNRFLLSLHERNADAALKARLFVIENRSRLSLNPTQNIELRNWLLSQQDTPPATLVTPVMRKVLHELYVAACQFVGPVNTDKALAAAITEAEADPAANLFAPRTLL